LDVNFTLEIPSVEAAAASIMTSLSNRHRAAEATVQP
jgi:hypothetical protein